MIQSQSTHPSDSSTPSNSPVFEEGRSHRQDEINTAVHFVLGHLEKESEYLDTVIQCSLRMKNLLQRRSTQKPSVESAAAEDHSVALGEDLAPHEQLTALRGDLARQFVPILEGRQKLQSAIELFQPLVDNPPTAMALAAKLADPERGRLKQLRLDIRQKLNEVRSITMGNQAVLIYTMDFYHRLLNGLSSDGPGVQSYNADGRLASQVGHGLLKKDC